MLRLAARGVLRRGPLSLRPAAAAVRQLSTTPDSRPMPYMRLQDQKSAFPDLVAEEEKTGLPAGLPGVSDAEVWANPEMLLPERSELWWDDGTAQPEWFVDRNWPVSTPTAALQLFTVLFGILGGGLAYGYMLGDNIRAAAPRWEHSIPYDMKREFGHKYSQYGVAAKYEEEEEEEE